MDSFTYRGYVVSWVPLPLGGGLWRGESPEGDVKTAWAIRVSDDGREAEAIESAKQALLRRCV
jgi:hypothetical protein